MKAATPIIGGIIAPPEDAAASTPPAKTFENPLFIIIGMVSTPVDSTFTTGPPVIVPNIAEETMAACAGPPLKFLVNKNASLINACPPAHLPKRAANSGCSYRRALQSPPASRGKRVELLAGYQRASGPVAVAPCTVRWRSE